MDQTPEEEKREDIDAVVDYLLRDQDYLLAKEIRHRVEELNQLLVQAGNQKIKVEFEIGERTLKSGGTVTHLEAIIYKRI